MLWTPPPESLGARAVVTGTVLSSASVLIGLAMAITYAAELSL